MTIKGVAATVALLMSTTAFAQEAPAAAPAAEAPAAVVLAPAFAGPIANNSSPMNFDLGGFGKIYVTGVASGIASTQSNAIPGDRTTFADVSNAQVFIQKVDGVVQFFVQAGVYSLPSLGTPYFKATTVTDLTYGIVPQAFLKIAPTSNFSVQAGLLPTLIGAEYTFSVENPNIARGLLWNQENAVNRGIQANLTLGKLSLSAALTDGFFSGKYNWVSASAAYALTSADTIAVIGMGSFSRRYKSTFATPVTLNNSQIYNIIYTHTAGKWVFQPYFQYTHVPQLDFGGGVRTATADTYGGAILARYAVTPNVSLPVRVEYIATSGNAAANAPNLLYGVGSKAFSFTVTPTYTYKVFFARAEFSVVAASSIAAGSAFGSTGNDKSQTRGLIELGVVF